MNAVSRHKRIVFFGTGGLLVLCASTPPASADECCDVNADAIIASDPAMGDVFGWSVSVDGNYAVVGAPNKDGIVNDMGQAYVFTFNVGNQTWEEQALLTAGLDAELRAHFGYSVAIAEDVAVIGAYRQDNGEYDHAGAAYIFVRNGVNWIQTAKLTGSDPGDSDEVGRSVAISGEVVVIGAILANNDDDPPVADTGAVYVWVKPAGGWGDADGEEEDAKLTASDGMLLDLFGLSVSIDGDVIVVGASRTALDHGTVYVFDKPANGWANANEDFILTSPDGGAGDRFGQSVSIDGDRMVIGAPFNDSDPQDNDEGAAYVFRFDGNDWIQEAKFSGCNESPHDQFGTSVAISGLVAVIGAIQPVGPMPGNGRADAFRYLGTGWAQVGKPNASDGESNDWFGQSVSMSGDFVVIGAPFVDAENPPPFQIGGFYVFDNFDLADACDCPWDLDGNGDVGVGDLLALLAA